MLRSKRNSWLTLVTSGAVCIGLANGGCKIPDPISVRTELIQATTPAVDSSPIIEMPVGPVRNCATKIGIVDVDGLMVNDNLIGLMSLGTNPVADFRAKLDYVRRHREIRAVVVRINSPGGGVTACDIMWRDLQQFKQETGLPLVACLMDVGAGGAYYLATGADLIVAHPTTVTGGIGVIFNAYEMEDFLSNLSIIGVQVKSGSQVDIGSPLRRMPDESRDILQQIADDFQARFHRRIEVGRGLALEGDEPFLDGRILTAPQAESLGLIDTVGYLDEAIEIAATQAGCGVARPVLLHRCRDRGETPYAITPNRPSEGDLLPLDIPGISRAKLPTFMYLWQPNPTYSH